MESQPNTAPTPPLRVVVATVEQHFYAPLVVERVLESKRLRVVGVLVPRVSAGGRAAALAARLIRQQGAWYVIQQFLVRAMSRTRLLPLYQMTLRRRPGAGRVPRLEEVAGKHSVPVVPMDHINRDGIGLMRELGCDVLVSVYFCQILKDEAIAVPRLGCVNIHPALLPRYRGSNPVFWAMLNGDQQIGTTVHWIDAGIDTGGILGQACVAFAGQSLHEVYHELSLKGGELLRSVLEEIADGQAAGTSQLEHGPLYRVPTLGAIRQFRRRGLRVL